MVQLTLPPLETKACALCRWYWKSRSCRALSNEELILNNMSCGWVVGWQVGWLDWFSSPHFHDFQWFSCRFRQKFTSFPPTQEFLWLRTLVPEQPVRARPRSWSHRAKTAWFVCRLIQWDTFLLGGAFWWTFYFLDPLKNGDLLRFFGNASNCFCQKGAKTCPGELL